MIARVATFDQLDVEGTDSAAVDLLRKTVRETPGFHAGYHLRDRRTGKALSGVIWESPEAAQATREALDRRPQEDRVGAEPDRVEFYEVEPF